MTMVDKYVLQGRELVLDPGEYWIGERFYASADYDAIAAELRLAISARDYANDVPDKERSRIRTLEAELTDAKRQLGLSGSARIAMLSARVEKLEAALRYWFPDEILIPEGHEVAWNEHVQLIPEHRLTAETAAESFERLQREQGIRSGSVTDGKVPQ